MEGLAVEVPKVFTRDRNQQRLVQHRSWTFKFLVVPFTILSWILMLQLHPQYRVMSLGMAFFALFTRGKQVRRSPGRWSVIMPWHVSSWTLAPHEVPSGSDEWVEFNDAVNSKTCF